VTAVVRRGSEFYHRNKKTANKNPILKTEAQEAEWWSKNQNLIANRFEEAKSAGNLGNGTVVRVARERASQGGVAHDDRDLAGGG
jgi:hypothetical protein